MSLLSTTTPIARYLVQTTARTDAIRSKVLEGLKANTMPKIQSETP